MAKKNKALETAQKVWAERKKKNKESGKAGGKATVPEVGKAQAEVVDCLLGKDNFENRSYNFELKIVGGVNEGRKMNKSLSLECKSPPNDKITEEMIISWSLDALEKLGVQDPFDRDEVEALTGAVIDITFHRSKTADSTKWPNIYFNGVAVPAAVDEEEETETPEEETEEVVEEEDDEFDYVEVQ